MSAASRLIGSYMKDDVQISESSLKLNKEHDPKNEDYALLVADFISDVDYGIPEIEFEEEKVQVVEPIESVSDELASKNASLEQSHLDNGLVENSSETLDNRNSIQKSPSQVDRLIV